MKFVIIIVGYEVDVPERLHVNYSLDVNGADQGPGRQEVIM